MLSVAQKTTAELHTELLEMARIFKYHDREKNRIHSYLDTGTLTEVDDDDDFESEDDEDDDLQEEVIYGQDFY